MDTQDGLQACRTLEFVNGNDLNIIAEDEGNKANYIPVIGMEFETEEDAYKFYNNYAFKVGFSIRLDKFHRYRDGRLRDRTFVCSSQGKRSEKRRDDLGKYHRAETRFGCLAKMKINCCLTGKYRVTDFVSEHTHVTTTPSKSHLHRSHRKMAPAQVAEAGMADSSGIAPKTTLELMSRQVGGSGNLGFIPDDYRNYLRSKRTRKMKTGDTGGILEYLQRMQLEDPNFFHAIQVDEDDMITNIFWADAKMMVDYGYFGDVVCFDTTYSINKDGRPFAMFVGVNHHKQTTTFGAALLYDETAETFMWLFDTFVRAMSGKKPKCILTDQDFAMAKALASQWPETCHRLCIWHIYQNAAKQLSGVFEKFKDFTQEFSTCIYGYEDETDFINAWDCMLGKYDLKENVWLKGMFNQREKWALVYGRDTFCADITTTQRSESMNSSLKNYVSYKHDLVQFFKHFQRLVDDRRYEELRADFRASQSSPELAFPVEILKHAASVYTPEVFKMFQNELCKAHDCGIHISFEIGTMTKYSITPYGKPFHHTVTFDSSNANTIMCSCKKFEFAGILCAHALKVFSSRNVMSIPSQYILKRWTRNVKARSMTVTCEDTLEKDPKRETGRQYKELCWLSTQLATRAAGSERAYKIATLFLNNALDEVDACLRDNAIEEPVQVTSQVNKIVPDGDGTKGRGIKTKKRVCSKSSRPKNALERATKKRCEEHGTSAYKPTMDDTTKQNSVPGVSYFSQFAPNSCNSHEEHVIGDGVQSLNFLTQESYIHNGVNIPLSAHVEMTHRHENFGEVRLATQNVFHSTTSGKFASA